MSTQTLQPLIWLARRCTSSRLIGTRARLMAFDTALSASIAPSTAKAGWVMRAVINMGRASGRSRSFMALTHQSARM